MLHAFFYGNILGIAKIEGKFSLKRLQAGDCPPVFVSLDNLVKLLLLKMVDNSD